MSGRIVTAFPADRFMIAGIGVAGVEVLTEHTAEAGENIRTAIEYEENKKTSWAEKIIEFIFDVSTANEGENLELWIEGEINKTTADVIREIEEAEQVSLSEESKKAIADLVAEAIGNPLVLEEAE
jgi:hypothetical protein